MRYLSVFKDVLDEEYRTRAQKYEVKDGKEMEWYVIQISLMHPEQRREELYLKMRNSAYPVSYQKFEMVLRAVNLDSLEKRNYIVERVKKARKDFCDFLNGDRQAAASIQRYMETLAEKDKYNYRMYFHAKYLLVYLYSTEQVFHSEQMKKVLECYLEGYCTTFLRKVYQGTCKEMKLTLAKPTKEVFDRTTRALTFVSQNERLDETQDTKTQIEKLKFQVENYQNTLQLVQSLFDELKESVEESAKEAQAAAVSHFFSALNGNEYGNILDHMGQVEQSIELLKVNHVKIPTELMPLIIIFKQFVKFFHSYGIEPVDCLNRTFMANCKELSCYNYLGEAFTNEKERKQVMIVAPGWKYQDTIISMPTVREV